MNRRQAKKLALQHAIVTLENIDWVDETDPSVLREMEKIVGSLSAQWRRLVVVLDKETHSGTH